VWAAEKLASERVGMERLLHIPKGVPGRVWLVSITTANLSGVRGQLLSCSQTDLAHKPMRLLTGWLGLFIMLGWIYGQASGVWGERASGSGDAPKMDADDEVGANGGSHDLGLRNSTRTKRNARQQQQNKAAQQRYRERRKQRFHEMEAALTAVQEQMQSLGNVQNENLALQVHSFHPLSSSTLFWFYSTGFQRDVFHGEKAVEGGGFFVVMFGIAHHFCCFQFCWYKILASFLLNLFYSFFKVLFQIP
jgi:hypothetical protein